MAIALAITILAAYIFSIVALTRIYRFKTDFKRTDGLILIIVIISALLLLSAVLVPLATTSFLAQRIVDASHMRGLSMALSEYSSENNDQLPPADSWCDYLIRDMDINPLLFISPITDAIEGESAYALNQYAAGMKFSEIPPDMVLLFMVKVPDKGVERTFPVTSREFAKYENGEEEYVHERSWNQVGGPEILGMDRYLEEGCNIAFTDGIVRYFKLEQLPNLRWKPDGQVEFPAELTALINHEYTYPKLLLFGLGTVVILTALVILVKTWKAKHTLFILSIGAVSTVTGLIFSGLAETLYIKIQAHIPGFTAGVIGGLLTGLCYAAFLSSRPESFRAQRGFIGYAASTGMVAGIICSCIVHLAIMLANHSGQGFGLVAGLPFGVGAGAVLGWISGEILKKRTPIPATANQPQMEVADETA